MTDSQRWLVFVLVLMGLGLIYILSPVLIPFLLAFLLAYFLNPLVEKLQRLKVPRIVSGAILFLLLIAILLALVLSVIPALEAQILVFVRRLPDMINWMQSVALPWVSNRFDIKLDVDSSMIRSQIMQHINANGGNFAKVLVGAVFNSGYLLFEIIMNLILIPVVTVYALVDWVKVTERGKLLLPFSPQRREIAVKLIRECGDVLAGFFRGQLMVMISLAIYYSIALSIIGLDFPLLIGVTVGTLSIVPYLGFIIGLAVGLITLLIQHHDWLHIFLLLGVFAVGQVCESMVFSPLFVGDRIGLHPIAVIFAVLAGGKLFGFVGILLALPAAAVIMVFFRYLQSRYFSEQIEEAV